MTINKVVPVENVKIIPASEYRFMTTISAGPDEMPRIVSHLKLHCRIMPHLPG